MTKHARCKKNIYGELRIRRIMRELTNFPCITMRFSQHILWGKVRVPVASKDWLLQSPQWRNIFSRKRKRNWKKMSQESFLSFSFSSFLNVAFFFFFLCVSCVHSLNWSKKKNCKLNCKDVSKFGFFGNGWRKNYGKHGKVVFPFLH